MTLRASALRLLPPLLAAALAAPASHAQRVDDFAWRGTLQTPANASLVRAALPADALVRLQSAQAADVRVFDAQGHAVPYAFAAPVDQPPPPRQRTAEVRALALQPAQPGARAPKGAMQVRVQDGASQRSVWVQMGGTADATPAEAGRLPSALFDTRALKQTIDAIVVQAQLPPNTPTRVTLWTSPDLAQWTPVPLAGRLFRFEGEGAPRNDTLALREPLKLEGQYLRLDWHGHDGVSVQSVAGLVASSRPAPPQVSAPLPAPRQEGSSALEWELPFATPLAGLALSTAQQNVLVPVRVLGRNQVSEPWRQLGHTVVYRLAGAEGDNTNPPLALSHPSVRLLRVEATHGMRLDAVPLTASARFEPIEIVFVAGGRGPYQLAAGGAKDTAAAALPLSMLAAAVSGKVDALPQATLVASTARAAEAPGALASLLPRGVDSKTATLWAVLLAGVLLLAGVAWSLLRRMGASG